MKKLSYVFFLLFFLLSAKAQDKLPSFGTIDKADVEMKDCSFDPGAEALVLIDVGNIKFSFIEGTGWLSEGNYRVRIKILKESALHRAAIKMRYYSKDRIEDITGISGISYNLNAAGNVEESKMERQVVFDKSIDKLHSEISFALPNVKVGTVFEYKYKLSRRSISIPSWTFQQSIPVKYSSYNVVIPEYFEFTLQTTERQQMQKIDRTNDDDGVWYIMRNVPGLKDEPYSSSRDNYLQRVEFQLSRVASPSFYKEFRTTWPKLIEELQADEDFGEAMKKNIKKTDDLDMQVAAAGSVKEKVRVIYNYVQRNMEWNEDYSLYTDNGIKDAWDKKNGNIADINFILIRLLRDADIKAKALLISTKDNGPINTFYPFLRQFNGVMAYVENGGEIYIMNAADKYNPFNLIPYDVLNTSALLIDKDNGGVIELQSDKSFSTNIFFSCTAQPDGKISGQSLLKSTDYARNIRMSTYKKGKLKSMLEDNDGITIKVDSISVANEMDELKPLEQKFTFSGSLQSSGEYYFLPFGLFTGLGKNPFVQENRVVTHFEI